MKSATHSLVRAAAAIVGTGGIVLGVAGTAAADPIPNCTTADVTAVMTGVSASMTTYLFTHPDVNDFFTSLQGMKKSDVKQKTQDYLAANPQVRDELNAIRQPGVDLRNRCNIPLKTEIASVI
ncbi:heme-binding protein [Mycobacterium sp. CVI_P3]|uniref:Heme-binding protein n=1 Tax=Mycobacterium pinniadriaticum TaxID=2994102 RepID=A0ABT3SKU4_9MYCO|nr:heme-binding protein [Mycobacterium pinniadriaticum]MCX2933655.1 heme-binding protein [Mycobacterium pinniadriaticum]MCX2940058.1 heme-binding protein [Mycobacterium pinniadriaticum]